MPTIEVTEIQKKLGEKVDGVIGYEVVEVGDDDIVLRVTSTAFNKEIRVV